MLLTEPSEKSSACEPAPAGSVPKSNRKVGTLAGRFDEAPVTLAGCFEVIAGDGLRAVIRDRVAVVGLVGFSVQRIRTVETTLPDHDALEKVEPVAVS